MNNFLLVKFQELVAEVRKAVANVWGFQVCVRVYTQIPVCVPNFPLQKLAQMIRSDKAS